MMADFTQNLTVLQGPATYVAVTDFTREVVHESERASEVIQRAIDLQAGAGGQVTLGKGTFLLDEQVRLGDNVWIRGSGRGTRLLVGEENGGGIGLYGQDLKGVEVSNLALTAGDNEAAIAGVVLDGCGDCKVRDVFGIGFSHYGIWVRNHSFLCEVWGCSLAGNGKAGRLGTRNENH